MAKIDYQDHLEPSLRKVIEGSYPGKVTVRSGMLVAVIVCSITGVCSAASQRQTAELSENQAEFKNENACIIVSIQANIYTYKVTNLSDSAIVGFEVPQHAAYDFKAPDGWEMNPSPKLFRAETKTSALGIVPGKSGDFSMRVSSEGAVLGHGTVKLRLRSGEDITLPTVWLPSAEPRGYIALVVGVLLFVVLLHSAIIILRDRRIENSHLRVT